MDLGTLVTIAVAIVMVAGTIIVAVINKRGSRETQLWKRLDEVESDTRVLTDYVMLLRQHIADGNPPPPPLWPTQLTNRSD